MKILTNLTGSIRTKRKKNRKKGKIINGSRLLHRNLTSSCPLPPKTTMGDNFDSTFCKGEDQFNGYNDEVEDRTFPR